MAAGEGNGRARDGASDEALARRLRERDAAALAALYDRYAPGVYAMAAHVLGPADAEEIVQDVFLRVWRKAEQYDPAKSAFGAWFMSVARHRVLDELRRRGHRPRTVAAASVSRALAEAVDPAADVERDVWLGEQAAALRGALGGLPEEQRRVVVLAYFGGFSQAAMAELLGWPLGTVKKRVRLGLQKLRQALRPLAADRPEGHPAAGRPVARPAPVAAGSATERTE